MHRGFLFWLVGLLLGLLLVTNVVFVGYFLTSTGQRAIDSPIWAWDLLIAAPYAGGFMVVGYGLWLAIVSHWKNGVTRGTSLVAILGLGLFALVALFVYAAMNDS